MEHVTGQVGYLQRIALPESARVNVVLIDKSIEDQNSNVIAFQSIEPTGLQVPFDFNIQFDANKIDPSHDYVLTGNVEIKGEEFFKAQKDLPVLTDGNPTQDIKLVLVSAL